MTTTLRQLLTAYPTLSTSDRLHMIVRWRVCPMPLIASYAPQTGVIVDLGCGHGLFTQLLAREATGRRVIGIDLDAHKIAVAQAIALPNLRFLAEDIVTADVPPVQAVTILDVFYLIPYALQEHLLSVCAAKLAPGGAILLKDMGESPRWKVALNWLEETLAVRVIGLTDHIQKEQGGGRFYFRTRQAWHDLFTRLGFAVETVRIDRGYYHPHTLFIARKQSI